MCFPKVWTWILRASCFWRGFHIACAIFKSILCSSFKVSYLSHDKSAVRYHRWVYHNELCIQQRTINEIISSKHHYTEITIYNRWNTVSLCLNANVTTTSIHWCVASPRDWNWNSCPSLSREYFSSLPLAIKTTFLKQYQMAMLF